MHALMQDWPLRVTAILDHAARAHPDRPVRGRSAEGRRVASSYAELRREALRVAQRLVRDGIGRGDAVGVMAWNTPRMMALWYGVPGSGAALHTLNPRLFPEQLVYIVNHARDRMLFVDADLAPVIAAILPRLETVERVVVLVDAPPPAALPEAAGYGAWLAGADGDFAWTGGDERDACGICYTSGTTGHPKGVVYTHRSNVLHALSANLPDMLGLTSRDTIMPVVPLFHANGWSVGYSAPMAGAAMVMPGRDMSPAGLYEMLQTGVTVTAAVPTVWLALLAHLEEHDLKLSTLERVVIGGASCPRAVIERFQDRYGVRVLHAWGMTEMSPLGTVCSFKPEVEAMDAADRLSVQETVGHPPFPVELRVTDDAGGPLAHDGTTQGRLWSRGPTVVRRYLGEAAEAVDADGWFDTGDVATIDGMGYVRITDRSKDVIKSGGEWISSIELENAAIAHPDVAEAAAVGVPHPKWGERPVLVVVMRPGRPPDEAGIAALMAGRFARWQLPDAILFEPDLPHTATGKISKLDLRRRLHARGYALPAEV